MNKFCHPFHVCTVAFFNLLLFLAVTCIPLPVHAAQLTLQWDPNDPTPQGYQLYHRAEGESYDFAQPVYDGNLTTAAVEVPDDGQTHYFVVRAYEGDNFSGNSNEAAYNPAVSAPPASPQTTNTTVWPGGGDIVELTPDLLAEMDLGSKQPLHTETRWVISTETDFSQKILDITTQTALTVFAVPDLVLDPGTVYFWKAEFVSSSGEILGQTPAAAFETLDASQTDDTDSDGVPDSQAIKAGTDLDRNGVDDADQSDMLCLKSAKGQSIIGVKVTSSHASIVSIKSIDDTNQSNSLNKPKIMTLGIISFKILLHDDASAATVTVYFSEPAPAGALWYKYDIDAGWQEYQGAVFSKDRRSVTFSIEDGGPGDDDGVRNGIIVDPSGLGTPSVNIPSSGASAAGGNASCFINALTATGTNAGKGPVSQKGLLGIILFGATLVAVKNR